MKRFWCFLTVFLALLLFAAWGEAESIAIDSTNFPDPSFREIVSSDLYDKNEDGVLSPEELKEANYLSLYGPDVQSVQGIENFQYLDMLICINVPVQSLNLSGFSQLTDLRCTGCGLASLNLNGCNSLSRLYCQDNRLTGLDLSECAGLEELHCENNRLSGLDVSGCAGLKELHCQNNALSGLTLGRKPELVWLYCQENGIRRLDISGCPGLLNLSCGSNRLTVLDVGANTRLQVIECENNMLSSLNVSACRDLGVLICWGNQLTTLDLTANTNLSSVNCAFNQLACLNVGHLPLVSLACNGNVRALTLNDSFLYLPNLPGFKPGKASNWKGGSVRNDTLYVKDSGMVTYQYDIGHDFKVEFALDIALASQQEAGIPIDEEHFPDAAFRSYVASVIDSDASGALSEAERNAVEALELGDMGISSLTGLQHFSRLQGLSCANNLLSTLDLSGNAAIAILNCSGNRLKTLDVSALSNLTAFSCAQNSLTALNLSGNPALQILSCGGNQLTVLDVSMCPALTLLECAGNRLTSLDISGNGALAGLDCSENRSAVTADQGNFDLSSLPGFDPSRASQWNGANTAGNVLNVKESGLVTYLYDCGRDVQIQFTLDVTVTNPPVVDPAEEMRNKPGNVTGDEAGAVDGRDVLRLAKYLAGEGVQINERAADVNADGMVDGRDLIRLARFLAGDAVELKQAS